MSRKNDFYLFFWSGLIMMVVGLFFLSQKVTVTNSFWGGGMRLMGMYINSGIVMVPFIFSLIWLFIKTNMASKVALVLSVILILASLIQSTRFYIQYLSLFDWVVMLVLIFGGMAFIAKSMLIK
ncbi:hypothetical protein HMPREF0491_02787 [Lachnospiraceae oral taxon 107 str. F0167]|jgi:hypothetical protein|uniref:hypothetical protein n=1 Tax=Lachnoanaerobaculum sp. Marseille-Q4761 TaxID=2819511 RepID=UPI00020838D2|nr:hypothetical protein [Lachnoanaerobaculum sp. Marseille-Q4761]EGG90442.1 hypothetical protein HMPREF0491_02787 [Lachnospiraceae oral taxon 107 str. F0167]MBO1870236.1 hypothetical protein [Lachnoanaerobaculum sp. Marseille-Q4761]DAI26891.1 MAG TPA: hypothetical protein [Caudoviricetes sp.]